MVQLNAIKKGNDVIISKDSFEHLLNCLANQKFVAVPDKQTETERKEVQEYVDDFWVQCMDLIHDKKKHTNQYKLFKTETHE